MKLNLIYSWGRHTFRFDEPHTEEKPRLSPRWRDLYLDGFDHSRFVLIDDQHKPDFSFLENLALQPTTPLVIGESAAQTAVKRLADLGVIGDLKINGEIFLPNPKSIGDYGEWNSSYSSNWRKIYSTNEPSILVVDDVDIDDASTHRQDLSLLEEVRDEDLQRIKAQFEKLRTYKEMAEKMLTERQDQEKRREEEYACLPLRKKFLLWVRSAF